MFPEHCPPFLHGLTAHGSKTVNFVFFKVNRAKKIFIFTLNKLVTTLPKYILRAEMSHNAVYLFSIYDDITHNVNLFSTQNLGNFTFSS